MAHGIDHAGSDHARPKARAIVAGQVGAGLGRGNEVIDGQAVAGVGQTDVDDLRPQRGQIVDSGPHSRLHFRLDALDKVFAGDADAQAANVAGERRFVVGHGGVERRGIARVVAGDDAQQGGGVGRGAAKRADLIERRREGDDAPARHAAVGGTQADQAAKRRGLAHAAASVGAQSTVGQPGGHGRSAAAATAAGNSFRVPRVARCEVSRVLGR